LPVIKAFNLGYVSSIFNIYTKTFGCSVANEKTHIQALLSSFLGNMEHPLFGSVRVKTLTTVLPCQTTWSTQKYEVKL
jgi:hypothetical protein